MQPGEAVSRSALDRPLHLLTEDDISQLTREDCRRFLKQKGMRRPSWNKSQAIQQVISLKALLETTSDSNSAPVAAAGEQEKLRIPASPAPKHVRIVEATNEPVGQMTIFYSGKVNVFDDISVEKARIVMQLAASPLFLPHAAPSEVITALWPFQSHLHAAGIKLGSASPNVIFPKLQTEKDQVHREGSNKSLEDNPGLTSRKASLQRYLEKKKDRFKHKRKVAVSSSASLDIYLNQVVRDRFSTAQLNPSDANSPSHPRPPQTPTRSNSVGNNKNKWRSPPDSTKKVIELLLLSSTFLLEVIVKSAENGDQ
ncbi:hypothetical protein TIFTF001_018026 [Ficus carica]|uniref:Protein TIFY n=1 Tax=Ficus carica TaxID=3494 RepID=A0AA88A689_FICCA|nr:hypothetical protein TIFTF001_018026 [Ficus carica]